MIVVSTTGGCASGWMGSPAEQVLLGFIQTMRRQFRCCTISVTVAVGVAQVVAGAVVEAETLWVWVS